RTALLLRRRRGVSGRAFRAFVHTRLGPALHAAGARDLRTYALLPLAAMAHTTFGVSHRNPPHRRYHGAVVFGTDTRAQVEDLIASPEAAAAIGDQHLSCTAIHAFAIDRTVPVIRIRQENRPSDADSAPADATDPRAPISPNSSSDDPRTPK